MAGLSLGPAVRRVGLLGLLLVACEDGPASPARPDASAPDATSAARDGGPDAGAPPDSGAPRDAGAASDAAPVLTGVVEATLPSGARRQGEIIAVYDADRWWTPAPGPRLALFDPTAFAAGLADDSVTVLWPRELVSVVAKPWADARPSHRALRRQEGLQLGRVPLDGPALVITAHETYHLEENGYGDFAWDLVQTDANGQRFTGLGADNADFVVWDAPVYLPTAGEVVEVVRDAPDNLPGQSPNPAQSNLVGVNIGGRTSLYLLHFRQGSIPETIRVGDRLAEGTYLGRVGNSGVSLEPHLHLTLLYWLEPADRPARYYSVPGDFGSVHVSSAATGPSERREDYDPPSGVWISAQPF